MTAAFLASLTGCSSVESSTGPSSSSGSQAQSTNAPYPATDDYLDEILALDSIELPEGATNVSVEPAYEFERGYPRGWGYVVYFRADEKDVQTFIEKNMAFTLARLDEWPVCEDSILTQDFPYSEVEKPACALGKGPTRGAHFMFERPLGRVWISIQGE